MKLVSFGNVWPLIVIVTVRATDVEDTVLNTSWDMFDASLKMPLIVIVKSARVNRVSRADLSSPVISWTSRGVVQSKLVISLDIVLADEPESSTAIDIPNPDSFAITTSLIYKVIRLYRLSIVRVPGLSCS